MKDLLLAVIASQIGPTSIGMEDKLEDYGIDSLDEVEIIMEIEARLDFSLDESRFSYRKTLHEWVEELERQVGSST